MTPLAHHIARQLAEPVAKCPPMISRHAAQLRALMADAHFFEVTAVSDAIIELEKTLRKLGEGEADDAIGAVAFLPAPTTWIEWKAPHFGRLVVVAREMADGKRAEAWGLMEMPEGDVTINWYGYISLHSGDIYVAKDGLDPGDQLRFLFPLPVVDYISDRFNGHGTPFVLGLLAYAQLATVLINTPKIVGRKVHPAHAGLAKTLRNSFGSGSFPLRGWTELKLHVAKPVEIDDGEPHEAWLSGRRALHFVRKFMRIRYNKIEYVTSHWRGDPAIGIKQTRYKVET